ncbi:signal transduction histidine kinase [Motilibacter rhizosphaerae]|uniref:histidine kinase n=1 Tax=Motilibacter rhizosphaerae TaxID=598652 RepID=A0A4Q7NVI2_9ACTN|nr:histidine kinase [Motilibacter rhizosphaerae]RZS91144.1 signal transduction histidine kinase [Motilibacter rhizosphaerae]
MTWTQQWAPTRRLAPSTWLTLAALPLMAALALTTADGPRSVPLIGALVVVAWLPLTLRSRHPWAVLVAVGALDTAGIAAAGHAHPPSTIVPVATILALGTVATRFSSNLVWAATASVIAVQLGAAVVQHPSGSDWLYLNWPILATVVGRLVKERKERIEAADLRAENAERTKVAEAERRVTAERVRIAHELHDVLAHHIALVNAQASVAQYLLERDPAAAAEALDGIAANSSAAMEELRATLGLLRDRDAEHDSDRRPPAPTLDQLDRLLATFTDAGLRLTCTRRGTPRPLTGPAEVALYRIVQEALTNATKHAPGAQVELTIEWTDHGVDLTVLNTPPTHGGALVDKGTGHGLVGIRERAAAAEGLATAGPSADGGFRVRAHLPLRGAPASGSVAPLPDTATP